MLDVSLVHTLASEGLVDPLSSISTIAGIPAITYYYLHLASLFGLISADGKHLALPGAGADSSSEVSHVPLMPRRRILCGPPSQLPISLLLCWSISTVASTDRSNWAAICCDREKNCGLGKETGATSTGPSTATLIPARDFSFLAQDTHQTFSRPPSSCLEPFHGQTFRDDAGGRSSRIDRGWLELRREGRPSWCVCWALCQRRC